MTAVRAATSPVWPVGPGDAVTVATAADPCADAALAANLEHLAQLVSAVLNEHTNQEGLCAVCGSAFPCESAVLAEHNAALL